MPSFIVEKCQILTLLPNFSFVKSYNYIVFIQNKTKQNERYKSDADAYMRFVSFKLQKK